MYDIIEEQMISIEAIEVFKIRKLDYDLWSIRVSSDRFNELLGWLVVICKNGVITAYQEEKRWWR